MSSTSKPIVSRRYAPIYTAIHTTVQRQPHGNMDETGWKEAGKRRWLWVVVTAAGHLLFHVATTDSPAGNIIANRIGQRRFRVVTSNIARNPTWALPPERRELAGAT